MPFSIADLYQVAPSRGQVGIKAARIAARKFLKIRASLVFEKTLAFRV